MSKKAEMRYIDQELWDFIQKFQELTNDNSTRQTQRKLAKRLNNIPLGMILNQPLQQETTNKKEKQEKPGFLKV